MKAQNYTDIRKAILKFSLYLTISVVMTTCFFFLFMKTSSAEVSIILKKANEYDQIRAYQLDLTEKMDTLNYYSSLLNPDSKINYKLMQNALSDRKIQFSKALSSLPDKDCLLYKRLAGQLNTFFDTKDSIITSVSELDMVRADLLRCISDNRKVSRTISTGGLTFQK